MELTILAAFVPLLLGVLLFASGIGAYRRRRLLGGTNSLLGGLLLMAVGALIGVAGLGMRSYFALTAETTAATVQVTSAGSQRFDVTVSYPDGQAESFALAGDELYLDARILKWHPAASFLGLRTGYQLDRIAGRYRALEDEQNLPRTVHGLAPEQQVDLFDIVRRFPVLAPLVDAEYGSASFVPVRDGGTYQLRVSPTGLLIRTAD